MGKTLKNIRLTLLFGLLTLSPLRAHSQTAGPGLPVTEFSVTGLKRTKLSVVEAALNQFIGRDADLLDLDAVYAAVLDTGVLEPVLITLEDAA
ncbi:MAG: hypothetical protein LBH18_03430, partial [Spirochaetaceae bacterium]|nr:hypothetical protein [Spirochaetaceae bacterium]